MDSAQLRSLIIGLSVGLGLAVSCALGIFYFCFLWQGLDGHHRRRRLRRLKRMHSWRNYWLRLKGKFGFGGDGEDGYFHRGGVGGFASSCCSTGKTNNAEEHHELLPGSVLAGGDRKRGVGAGIGTGTGEPTDRTPFLEETFDEDEDEDEDEEQSGFVNPADVEYGPNPVMFKRKLNGEVEGDVEWADGAAASFVNVMGEEALTERSSGRRIVPEEDGDDRASMDVADGSICSGDDGSRSPQKKQLQCSDCKEDFAKPYQLK